MEDSLMDLDYIEDKIDVFIENSIKDNRLRRKIDYGKKILHKGNSNSNITNNRNNDKHQAI